MLHNREKSNMICGSTADKSMFKLFIKRRNSGKLTISFKIERKVDPTSMLHNLFCTDCEWFTIAVARFLWLMAKVSTNCGPANMDGRNNEKIYMFLWLSCVWFHSRKNLLFFHRLTIQMTVSVKKDWDPEMLLPW